MKMSTGWWPRKIHCPNCHYEGQARLKGTGCLSWIVFLALFFVSFLFGPLFIVTALLFLYFLLKPSNQICPKCGWEFPIPTNRKRKTSDRTVTDPSHCQGATKHGHDYFEVETGIFSPVGRKTMY